MSYDITGKIIQIFDTAQVSATFRKRELAIETVDGDYSELIKLEFMQDKCDLLDGFAIGQEVSISFNLKGREWINPQGEAKYFNTLSAWKIEAVGQHRSGPEPDQVPQSYTAPPVADHQTTALPQTEDAFPPIDDSSDVPFNRLGDFEQ